MLTTRYILDEAHLKHYDEKLKSWASSQPVKTIPPNLYPWTQTAKAGAVTCWPVGGTPLLPTVDFLFTETPPASGDKSPSNPSTITSVSEVKVGRTGKNLLFPSDFVCLPDRGITATVNQDGSVSVSGTTSGNGLMQFRSGGTTTANTIKGSPFIPGLTYTVSMECSDSNVVGYVHYSTNGGVNWSGLTNGGFTGGQSRTFTVPAGTTGLQIWTQTTNGITLNTSVKMQCELGETATAFEKSVKDTYTINLNDTYYGGSIDLASGVMTVTFAGIVLDGSENWVLVGSGTYYRYKMTMTSPAPAGAALAPVYNTEKCTHFDIQNNVSYDSEHAIVSGAGITIFTTQTSLESFKQWLAAQKVAGTPVCLAWPLASPSTVQLTPTEILSLTQADKYTPRLNTVYTDASAVQVGYVKSPIRDEYELQQAIVAQGGNI